MQHSRRERFLIIVLLSAILLGGGGFAIGFLYLPMRSAKVKELANLRETNEKAQDKLREQETKKIQLDKWRKMSLPSDKNLAWNEYSQYLDDLTIKSGFAAGTLPVKSPKLDDAADKTVRGKKPPFTKLTYTLDGHGTLANLVTLLEGFYKTGVMHQIKKIKIYRPDTVRQGWGADELELTLVIEALIVDGAKPAPIEIKPGAGTPLVALSEREYALISKKNIFFGPAPPLPPSNTTPPTPVQDIARWVRLSSMIEDVDNKRIEVLCKDWLNSSTEDRMSKIRADLSGTPSKGYSTFNLRDTKGEAVVKGNVVRVDLDNRDVYFYVETPAKSEATDKPADDRKYYRIHIGESFDEALRRKPLQDKELKELKLIKDEKPVKDDKTSKTEEKTDKPTQE